MINISILQLNDIAHFASADISKLIDEKVKLKVQSWYDLIQIEIRNLKWSKVQNTDITIAMWKWVEFQAYSATINVSAKLHSIRRRALYPFFLGWSETNVSNLPQSSIHAFWTQ